MTASRRQVPSAPRSLTEAEAQAVYGILVEEAGARPGEDEVRCFVRYASRGQDVEWRFSGKLGFGGKLYFDGWDVPRVGCYPEDDTPERKAIIGRTNARLADLLDPSNPEAAS